MSSTAMDKIGFSKSKSDGAVFYRHSRKGFAIIAVAVDDLTITAKNDDIIQEIKADLMKIFKMKDLGELHWLLNFKIGRNRTEKSISFSQEAYIDKILNRFNLQDSKTHITPLDPNMRLTKEIGRASCRERV